MVVDGTVFDVPDTEANARVWGYPGSRPLYAIAAFPLIAPRDAGGGRNALALSLQSSCPYRMGERVRALKLLRSVTAGMLLMWDRGLHSYKMIRATLARGCMGSVGADRSLA